MASLFSSPKVSKPKPVKTQDAEQARAAINRERRRASGSNTIFGSRPQGIAFQGLKNSTGL